MRTWTHDQIQLLKLAAKDLREAQKGSRTAKMSRLGALTSDLDRELSNETSHLDVLTSNLDRTLSNETSRLDALTSDWDSALMHETSRLDALTSNLDRALANVGRDASGDPYPDQDVAQSLVTACFDLRLAQHNLMWTEAFLPGGAQKMRDKLGLATESVDEALEDMRQAKNVDATSQMSI